MIEHLRGRDRKLEPPARAALEKKAVTRATPQKKPGGRSRPHLSLREGLEQPPTWFFQGVLAALGS